jgi:hypothetical protein
MLLRQLVTAKKRLRTFLVTVPEIDQLVELNELHEFSRFGYNGDMPTRASRGGKHLAARLASRVQLATGGHRAYLSAVDIAFNRDIDYAMLVKIYGDVPEAAKRYSPAECLGADKTVIRGLPDPEHRMLSART